MPIARPNLDWKAIRPINGSPAEGFEELCAQLARAETPSGARFERKAPPDGGVECYAIFGDGSEWGWQAKYFDGLGDSQWSQLDESIRKALEKHPRLVRYFVCVPLDRSDARIVGRRSAKERWDDHVQKWTGWASACNMTVEFDYWGSHELLERLADPQHLGRIRFWFDAQRFDSPWFTARLDEALKTAGPRYTPEVHVDLPIAAEFEAFGRTEQFFDRIKACAKGIRRKLSGVEHFDSKTVEPTLTTSVSELLSRIQALLAQLGALTVQPTGLLPLREIADEVTAALVIADQVERLLEEHEQEHDTHPPVTKANEAPASHSHNPFREQGYRLMALSRELRQTRAALGDAESVANASLLLLTGAAGVGKTHLLCDVTQQRVAAGRPTVLLMGQQFISLETPWTQALQHLDLTGLSTEEFVGALEAAAQAAGCRALVLVDAINEGAGRLIWPSHLAAFLAHLQRSPWIGVVISVRSSYEERVIPPEVRAQAIIVTHEGFADHEYDATRTFFLHYGLELPSTPLLVPEFRNPLFLKTLCCGLNAKGERRLPRGFHGITAIFNLYLNAINDRLATALGFNPKDALVRRALESFATTLADSGKRWLTLETASKVVDTLLPNREFNRSLYRGLVVEGILVEEAIWHPEGAPTEVVLIAYERLADHVITKTLLDAYLDIEAPASFFTTGGLAFLGDQTHDVTPGLIEAMCIQIPERTGQELFVLAPQIMNDWPARDAFRQSLIWRSLTAFTNDTREVLQKSIQNSYDSDSTLDALLTVATLSGHPFNATFLDARVRRDCMPDRDAWWSTYLHRAWEQKGAVHRLVDWASAMTPDVALDEDLVDLSATALTWMLTTANRFLRDRATKALVSLLTGRLDAVIRLVERFSEVDDLYVSERIYAVAYGTAMRSQSATDVGALAECVYAEVFAGGSPPAHILLRDYARGVVERAIFLGAVIDIVPERIRPPYMSQWPVIPTESDIQPLMPDWSQGSHDSGELEWARNRIGSSVFSDDFAHYVIGTNSSSTLDAWLDLGLDQPAWRPPEQPDSLLRVLGAEFTGEARQAWDAFDAAEKALEQTISSFVRDWFTNLATRDASDGVDECAEVDALAIEFETNPPPSTAVLEQQREAALAALTTVLSDDQRIRLEEVLAAKALEHEKGRRPPQLDARQIQRYILWRVFDLGWTTERFGKFDRFSIGYHGRDASKAERIGKKYQWLAYHEIMALVADHFQYREPFSEDDSGHVYDGPWQTHLRDIDPSCTLRSTPGGTSWDGHSPSWWCTIQYRNWENPTDHRNWAACFDDLPKVENLLSISHPTDATRWVNAQGYFHWQQHPPADQERTDVDLRELWYICTGYLIRSCDVEALLRWAEDVDFWGRWMPEPPEVYSMFLGEYGWSTASRYFEQQCFGNGDWQRPSHGCTVQVKPIAFEYLRESGGFDCSVDDSYTLRLPASELVTGLELRWSGRGADYLDATGQLAALDPTAYTDGASTLLIREDLLQRLLARKEWTVCWAILGEKRALGAGLDPRHCVSMKMSGVYVLGQKGPTGFLKCKLDEWGSGEPGSNSGQLAAIRSVPRIG
jgi:hypothetical protein